MRKFKLQSGFTLIELVSVLVILGILAAVAIPRFINLTESARVASVNGMLGAVRSAATLAHAQALTENQTGATGTVTMEGTSVALVHGYPSTAGIASAMGNVSGFGFAGGVFTLQDSGGADVANCLVTYVQPAAANTAPTITTTTTGCQ